MIALRAGLFASNNDVYVRGTRARARKREHVHFMRR